MGAWLTEPFLVFFRGPLRVMLAFGSLAAWLAGLGALLMVGFAGPVASLLMIWAAGAVILAVRQVRRGL